MKHIIARKVVQLKAVFWDGKFKSADNIRHARIFDGMQHSTAGGELSYINRHGELRHVPRNTYVLRDGDEIKYYYQTGDSLIENDYEVLPSTD